MQPLVGLIMGSASDWETLQHAAPQGYRSGFLFFASANDKQSVGTGVEFFEKKSTPVPLGCERRAIVNDRAGPPQSKTLMPQGSESTFFPIDENNAGSDPWSFAVNGLLMSGQEKPRA